MKHLANYFKIMLLDDFQSFDGTSLIGTSDQELIVCTNDLIFDEPPKSGDHGTIYEQSLRAVSGKLTTAQRAKYVDRRPVVVLLYDDEGIPYLWGNGSQKLRISINPKPDNDVIELTCMALSPIF